MLNCLNQVVASLACISAPFLRQAQAWQAWTEYVADRQGAKEKAVNAIAFWSHQQLAQAFQHWQAQVQAAQEMKSKAAVIVGRMTHSAQARVLQRHCLQAFSVLSFTTGCTMLCVSSRCDKCIRLERPFLCLGTYPASAPLARPHFPKACLALVSQVSSACPLPES